MAVRLSVLRTRHTLLPSNIIIFMFLVLISIKGRVNPPIRWTIFFLIYLILPAALGTGVYSASNRNEYQKQKNNVSGEQSAAGA
jgi:hypothetical protein